MTSKGKIGIAGFVILILTVACFSTTTPIAPQDTIATVVAATMQVVTLLNTPTSLPTVHAGSTGAISTSPPKVSTAVPPAAIRMNFLTDATTGVVSGTILPAQIQYYVLNASQGQPLIVTVNSPNNDVSLSIRTQGGTSMLNQSSHLNSWETMLPQTEDYYIGVHGGATSENYTLTVEIPSRIKFQPGADSATVTGKTVGGYPVAFIVLAVKDQKMSVNLNSQGNSVALTIYGYTDGQAYLRSITGKYNFILRLPSTQDYIIEVVPAAGKVVVFDMLVNIK